MASVAAPSHSSFLFCEVCDVQATSEKQLCAHMMGQRHWRNMRMKGESERSVYVRGFPSDSTTIEDLSKLFEQFGSVHRVIMEDKGQFAIVEFSSTESSLQALRHPTALLLGGNKLVVKPRELKVQHPPGKPVSIEEKSKDDSMDTSGHKESIEEGKPVFTEEESKEDPMDTSGHKESVKEDEYSMVRLNIERNVMEQIASLESLDEQILLLVSKQKQLQSSPDKYKKIIAFHSYLQSRFSVVFPSCRLVPFGSFVTEQTTPTSDFDLLLCTEWTETDQAYLGDILDRFFSSDSSPMDTDGVDFTSEGPVITPTFMATPIPSRVRIAGKPLSNCSEEYCAALRIVGQLSMCTKIMAITAARIPIIKFTVPSLNMSSDISVNKRLCAYNTKLLKTYLNFDSRVPPLLCFLKTWLRSQGITANLLNNYSLSLMLIYALQNTTPPVLPCLQSPGSWPLNMAWYGERGFVPRKEEAMFIDGWKVDVVDSNSLLPSNNTSSLAELLLHFFQFYSKFDFESHAVTIHSLQLLTINDAVRLSEQTVQEGGCLENDSAGGKPMKVVSPLCVQDPFDLSHNVTKSVSRATFNILTKEMKRGAQVMVDLLSGSPSHSSLGILSLFAPQAVASPSHASHSYKTSYEIQFSMEMIDKLVEQIPAAVGLRQFLPSLDLKSEYTLNKMDRFVIRCLADLLENKFDFLCTLSDSDSHSSPFYPLNTCSVSTITDPATSIQGSITDSSSDIGGLLSSGVDTNAAGLPTLMQPAPFVQKRAREDDIDPVKKYKIDEEERELLPSQLFDQFSLTPQGLPFPTSLICTTYIHSWRKRKFRRLAKAAATTGIIRPTKPVLQFNLSSMGPSGPRGRLPVRGIVTSVVLSITNTAMSFEFSSFFSVLKQTIVSSKP